MIFIGGMYLDVPLGLLGSMVLFQLLINGGIIWGEITH